MVSAIFTELSNIISAFATMLVSLFEAVAGVFYTPGTSGAAGSLTIVGTLTLISVGVAIVMWAFAQIRRMIRVKAN